MGRKPNIVLIILDSARSDMFGCYGDRDGLTPHIDELAAEGLLCRNNYAAGNGSAMGHTGIFTGQHPARHKMVHNFTEMPQDLKALPVHLRRGQYQSFGHLQVSFIPPAGYEDLFGFTELIHPGKRANGNGVGTYKRILEFLKNRPWLWKMGKDTVKLLLGDEWRIRAAAKTFDGIHSIRYLINILKKYKEEGGIFAYTTLMHPHNPYYPPSWCLRRVPGYKKINKLAYRIQSDFYGWINGNYGEVPEAIASIRTLYRGELVYADHLVGQLIAVLRAEEMFENTIFVVTSDHGELLGEHDEITHGGTVWEEVYRTPLIIRYPQAIPKGTTIKSLTSNLDIVSTLLDLVGILDMVREETTLDGQSLIQLDHHDTDRTLVIDSPPTVLPERLKAYPKIMATARRIARAIVTRQHKYIWFSDGIEYLYRQGQKETEENNCVEKNQEIASNLKQLMTAFYRQIDPQYRLDHYPLKITRNMGKKFGNIAVLRELKKLGYM